MARLMSPTTERITTVEKTTPPADVTQLPALEDLELELGYAKVDLRDEAMLAKNTNNVC